MDYFYVFNYGKWQELYKQIFWLNLTCYVNRMLSYHDSMYFDFLVTRQFQFPLKNIYNHNPIYGISTKNPPLAESMNDDEFRLYRYMDIRVGINTLKRE